MHLEINKKHYFCLKQLIPIKMFGDMMNMMGKLKETQQKIEETKKRIQLYENAGANGIFIPCIKNIADIKEIVTYTKLPINVMCVPNLPNFDTLTQLGVKRIGTSAAKTIVEGKESKSDY